MEIRKQIQKGVVSDEVQALIAVVRPIILGTLYSMKREVINDYGGVNNIKLRQLARAYKPGDGDCGICFEYAVHDAIVNGNPVVIEKIDDALTKHCKIKGDKPSSILFGAEKDGTIQLIKSVKDYLTKESKLLAGSKGQPVKLKKHIDAVYAAFRSSAARANLPESINGLWKADLFVGKTEPDQWVGTTVKINSSLLEHAPGLRLGLVPSKEGKNDSIKKDDIKNLIICPLPYDDSFMQIFYQGWQIVKQFLHAEAYVPKEANLSRPSDRQVCRFLEEKREFPVVDVLEALFPLAQPELFYSETESDEVIVHKGTGSTTGAVIAPISKQ